MLVCLQKNTTREAYLISRTLLVLLTICNEGTYLTFKSIFHKALTSFLFDCEITLESIPEVNQYKAISI